MLWKLFLAAILYLPLQVALSPTAGIDLASIRILIIALAALWLTLGFLRRKLYLPATAEAAFLLTFLFFNLLSLLTAENPTWGWRKVLFLLSFVPLFFLASDFGRDPGRRRKIITFSVMAATIAASVALLQFTAQFMVGLEPILTLWRQIMPFFLGQSFGQAVLDFPSWLVNIGGRTFFRAVGFLPDPHMLAFYLNLAWPWSLLAAWQARRRNPRIAFVFAATTCLLLAATLATFSRGAYLGIFGGLLFLGGHLVSRQPSKKTLVVLVLAVLFSAWLINLAPVAQRFGSIFNLDEGSNSQRLATWRQAWTVAQDHWLTGVGIGNYPLSVRPTAGYRDPIYAHNLYLDILAETGIFGLTSWLGLVGIAIADFLKKSGSDKLYLSGALSLIIFSVHAFFETPLFSVHVLPVLLITLSLAQRNEK